MVSRLVVGLVAMGLAASVFGCDEGVREDVKESARGAAQNAVETAESNVGATLERKGDEVRGTAESKGEELKATAESKGEELRSTAESLGEGLKGTAEAKGTEIAPTVAAAATDVAGTLTSLRDVSETLDGFPKAVLGALGTLADQAAVLRDDRSLIEDEAWLRDTNDAIDVLEERGADALAVADQLAEDDRLPAVASSLREVGGMLVDTAESFRTHVESGDADGFLNTTNRLALIRTAVNLLGQLVSFDD